MSVIALTDHDTTDGLGEAVIEARRLGLTLVNGVEISVTWSGRTLHVVGLGIDPSHDRLVAGLSRVREGRLHRAWSIGEKLKGLGVSGAFDAARDLSVNPEMVSRTHFARYLVSLGLCKDHGTAFRRFLGEGKPAYVRHTWASLSDAVAWIVEAGGIPVLAHPGRYGLRRARLHALFSEFRALGGIAVEVVTASHSQEQTRLVASLSIECGLLASAGSDFHGVDESWLDIGQLAPLPSDCDPVWRHERLQLAH